MQTERCREKAKYVGALSRSLTILLIPIKLARRCDMNFRCMQHKPIEHGIIVAKIPTIK